LQTKFGVFFLEKICFYSQKRFIFALMNTTIRHIEFLVSTHNCVVIPGLGAILAHNQCAQISANGLTITPPHRVYTFNSSLTQTDGLVEHSVARSLETSYERAAAIVASDIDTMRHQLANDRSLSLGRVGTLEQDNNGNVQFTGFSHDALTPGASWLPSLDISYMSARGTADASESNETVRVRRLSPVARFARAAAAAVVIAFVAFASSTPITIKDANYASIALPEVKAPHAEYVPSTSVPVLDIIDMTATQVPVDTAARAAYQQAQKLPTAQPEPAKAAVPTATPSSIRMNDSDAYCVVIASVNNTNEAQEYIAEAKRKYGENCALLAQDGRYRIIIATAPTTVAARQAISNGIAKRHLGAWVCAR
jgi:septal ring-binding cell division protein DamX